METQTYTDEIWKQFLDGYYISNYGRIKSQKRCEPIIMKLITCRKGYLKTTIQRKTYKCHRLVALYFLETPLNEEQFQVDHIDRNKQNNHYTNLRWVSNRENMLNTDRATRQNVYPYDTKDRVKYCGKIQIDKIVYCKSFNNEQEARNWVDNGSIEEARKIRKRGTGYIREYQVKNRDVRYFIEIKINKIRYTNTFKNFKDADEWLEKIKTDRVYQKEFIDERKQQLENPNGNVSPRPLQNGKLVYHATMNSTKYGTHHKTFQTNEEAREWLDKKDFSNSRKIGKKHSGNVHNYQTTKGEERYKASITIQGKCYRKTFLTNEEGWIWIQEIKKQSSV